MKLSGIYTMGVGLGQTKALRIYIYFTEKGE